MRKYFSAILLALLAVVLLVLPVLAYIYRAPLTVVESSANAYTMLPVRVAAGNVWMAANGFFKATGLDTRVENLGGAARPHMVADDKTLFATAVPANSQTNLYFTTGNADLAMSIITGYKGYVATPDQPGLELASNGSIDVMGYLDTPTGPNKNIAYKLESLVTYVSAANTVTAGMINTQSYALTFVGDAAWKTIDVSTLVGSGATGVVLEVISNDGNPYDTAFRKNGSVDDRYKRMEHEWVMVGLDSSMRFQARAANNAIDIYLRGYTDSSWTFNTNAVDVSFAAVGVWTDVDVTAHCPAGTDGVIVEIIDTAGTGPWASGVRKNGSTDARINSVGLNNHYWAIIGIDAGDIFEGYIGNASVDMFVIGYAISGTTFATNATDKSLAGAGAWTDVDCSANAPSANFLFFEVTGAIDLDYGFRNKGSSETLYGESESNGQGHAWSVVECDYAQVVEGEIEALTIDYFLIAYTTSGIYSPVPTYTYIGSAVVAVAGLTGGARRVVVSADAVLFTLTVYGSDGVTVLGTDTDPIGAGVTDNDSPWYIGQNNVMPYITYYKHTTNIAPLGEKIKYQPDSIIIGTTLPNEDAPGTYDGVITWGTNPTGVAVTLGSMVVASQPVPGTTTDRPTRDILPETQTSDWFQAPSVTGTLTTHPLRPFVTILSDSTTLTERQAWVFLGLAFVLAVAVGVGSRVRGHHLITGVAVAVAIIALVVQTIWPGWSLVIAIVAILAGLVSERSPSL